MCLILIAYHVNADWPLIVLDNRDEFYKRPTAQLGQWPGAADVLAGRDLQSGGTWMGAHRDGRWAAVTNFREPRSSQHASKSRGWLVRDYLLGSCSARAYLDRISDEMDSYAGLNLLVGDREGLWCLSNREPGLRQLSAGLYGVSNGRFDAPWPKVCKGKEGLARLLANGDWDSADLFALMADQSRAVDAELPATGVPLEWERALSAMFIVTQSYGTRSTSVLTMDRNGDISMMERHFTDPPRDWLDIRYGWPACRDQAG
jgi:uncharacterized protein with NRDE domain